MQFVAKVKNIPFSPYKLRPLADVVRGKDIEYVLGWLATHQTKRVRPVKKLIESAVANAKSTQGIEMQDLRVEKITVDEGRIFRYYKPGAMGRAATQRRRFCHISVVLGQKSTTKKA